jgi:uncharacterized repeat protein (TIGR02543 family)
MAQLYRFNVVMMVVCAALMSACDNDTPLPNPSASPSHSISSPSPSPSVSATPSPSASPIPSPSASVCSGGTGNLVISNNSGEDVAVAVTSGSTAFANIAVSNGTSVSTAEPIGTIQVTATGNLTGNQLLQATPAILCNQNSNLAIASEISYAISVSNMGSGFVSLSTLSGSIPCLSGAGNTCSATFLANQEVTLTEMAQSGSQFSGWSGACTGSASSCTVTMSQAQSVSAQFAAIDSALNVVLGGNGQGSVVSNPSSISCGDVSGVINAACSANLAENSVITLTATAAIGSQFAGWDGFCLGQQGRTCQITISQMSNVSANFTLIAEPLTLSVNGTGTGAISGGSASGPYPAYCASAGDSVPQYQQQNCSPSFNYGAQVILTAMPDANMSFTGWTGACSGNSTTCTVSMNQAQSVTAQFTPIPESSVQVATSGSGQGSVASLPVGISCASALANGCTANFADGGTITLSSAASNGSTFKGWTSGPCTGSSAATCTFAVSTATSVTADFEPVYVLNVGVTGPGTLSGGSINCTALGGTCSTTLGIGQDISLQAAPVSGATFIGWQGLCANTSGTLCQLAASQVEAAGASATVTAVFADVISVRVDGSGSGSGAVSSSAGIGCTASVGSPCSTTITDGLTITLTAAAASGSVFSGWTSGPCKGSTSASCTYTASPGTGTITARFDIPESLSVAVTGNSSLQISYTDVFGNPVNGTCDSMGEPACNQNIPGGTIVTLSAAMVNGFVPITWGGSCAGAGHVCQVTMNQAQSVTMHTPYTDTLVINALTAGNLVTVDYVDPFGNHSRTLCTGISTCTLQLEGGSSVIMFASGSVSVMSGACAASLIGFCTFTTSDDGSQYSESVVQIL